MTPEERFREIQNRYLFTAIEHASWTRAEILADLRWLCEQHAMNLEIAEWIARRILDAEAQREVTA